VSDSTKNTFNLKVESKSANLRFIREYVLQKAKSAGFVHEDLDKIELSVDEACSNVVKHAYRDGKKHFIEIKVKYNSKAFVVIVSDKGRGFDPSQLPQTDMKTYLERYQVGGLGIHLMKSLMDVVEYRINPGKKNQVILVKYIK